MQLQDAEEAVAQEGGFDSSSTATPVNTIRGWINESIQTALAKSRFLKATVDLGPTVADQDVYDLPATVLHIRTLRVGESIPYMALQSIEDLWAVQAGTSAVWPGAFYGTFAEDGEAPLDEDTKPTVTIFPGPVEAGLSIEAVCAVLPPEILPATAGTLVLPLPQDLVHAIAVDGAIAIGMERIENRPDLAASFKTKYDDATGELAKRARNRVGGGTKQMRIVRPRIR